MMKKWAMDMNRQLTDGKMKTAKYMKDIHIH